jgi:hypothetical protein
MRHLIKLSTVVVVLIGTWTMTLAAQEQSIKLVRFEQSPPAAPAKTPAIDLSVKPLSAVSLSIAPPTGGSVPTDLAAKNSSLSDGTTYRTWQPYQSFWQASAMVHQPLYFEQVNLERYGHHAGCWQPVISGAHFFGTVAVLPYKIGAQGWHTCQSTLGHSRPGNCNAWEPHDLQWSARGALYQTGAIYGGALLIP